MFSIGASTPRIILGEVLPNVMPQLVVVATVEAAHAILLEAALSFLGLGTQPPAASWGNMLTGAQELLQQARDRMPDHYKLAYALGSFYCNVVEMEGALPVLDIRLRTGETLRFRRTEFALI